MDELHLCIHPAQKDWYAFREGTGICYIPAGEPGRSTGYTRQDFLALAGGHEQSALRLFAACTRENPENLLDLQRQNDCLAAVWGGADYRRFLQLAQPRVEPLAVQAVWELFSREHSKGAQKEQSSTLRGGEREAMYFYMGILAAIRTGEMHHIDQLGILLNGEFHSLWKRGWIGKPWGERAWWVDQRRLRVRAQPRQRHSACEVRAEDPDPGQLVPAHRLLTPFSCGNAQLLSLKNRLDLHLDRA